MTCFTWCAECKRWSVIGAYQRARKSPGATGRGTEIARILFVQYHSSFRQSASYMMGRKEDLDVVSRTGSVASGRERMAEGGIDAAVVDRGAALPDEGAAEMVRELHETNPSVPVLVLTHPVEEAVRDGSLGRAPPRCCRSQSVSMSSAPR